MSNRLDAAIASRLPGLLAVAALASCLSSCRAERHLIFETDPPGATVRINDLVVGQTPLDLPFEHYGERQVTIYREGYHTHSQIIDPRTPWYSYFPLDFITEVLLPLGWEDIHRYEIVLESESGNTTEEDLEGVLRRAESLRRAGPGGPAKLTPAQAAPR